MAHHAEVGVLCSASLDLVITGRVAASFLALLGVRSLVLVGGLHILLVTVCERAMWLWLPLGGTPDDCSISIRSMIMPAWSVVGSKIAGV